MTINEPATEHPLTKTGKSLLSDDLFQRLRLAQQDIALHTDMMPTLRKMLDEIITDEAIFKAKESLIELYS